MENLKTIKDRIRTVNSIIKATSAMKMVSTIKLSKINNLNKSSKECANILSNMFSKATQEIIFEQQFDECPWFARKHGKTLIIVLLTDQGFCGAFNQSLNKKALETISNHNNAYVEVFGKKAKDIVPQRADTNISCEISSRYDIDSFSVVLTQLVLAYIHNHNAHQIYVISGEFKNVLVQKAQLLKIFPIESNINVTHELYTSIEGSRLEFINDVFEMYLSKRFKAIITEHLISELSARVMAMDNSVRNAKDMFEKLNTLYNRIRQDHITQELTEIISSIECVQ